MTSAESDKLDLSNRQLASIPPKIWRNTSLRVLNLFRNELKSLSASIAQLKELRVLIVANNQLRTLPQEISALRHLRMFDAGHNLIADLPQSFARLNAPALSPDSARLVVMFQSGHVLPSALSRCNTFLASVISPSWTRIIAM